MVRVQTPAVTVPRTPSYTLQSSPEECKSDKILDRIRAEQCRDNEKAARDFIENKLGEKLPQESLHKLLYDGVVLCR